MGIAADRGAGPADFFQTQPVHFFDFHNSQAVDDEGVCAFMAADYPLPIRAGRIRPDSSYFSHFVIKISGPTIVGGTVRLYAARSPTSTRDAQLLTYP